MDRSCDLSFQAACSWKLNSKTLGFPAIQEGREKTASSIVGHAWKADGHLCVSPRPAVLVELGSLKPGSQLLFAHLYNGAGMGTAGSLLSRALEPRGLGGRSAFLLAVSPWYFVLQFPLLQMRPIKVTALRGGGKPWVRPCV